jgi:hypothetical protein
MNRNLVITKLLAILIVFAFCTPAVYASKEEIDRANLGIKISQHFGVMRPMIITGDMHKVKNKKGQVRRVWARPAVTNAK